MLAAWLPLLLVSGCNGDAGGKGPGAGPDMVLISIDTLRADRLALYGAPTDADGGPGQAFTPRALGEIGRVFEQCWAPSGKTVPSLASFWTGRTPLEHGAISNFHVVQAPTHAERLRARGWRTHAAVANRALAQPLGLERGFETFSLFAKEREGELGAALAARAGPAIESHERQLLWAHFMSPHQPYAPPPELAARYAPGPGPAGDNDTLFEMHRDPDAVSAQDVQHLRGLYDAEVRLASDRVAALLADLDARYRSAGRGGLFANAVVVFFADHGEELGDRHGYFLHAKSLYSGVTRVPLVIAGPGVEPGRERTPLDLQQVFGLVADAAGVPRKQLAAAETQPQYRVATWKDRFFALRDARWTLVHNPCLDLQGPAEPPVDAAYAYPAVALYDRSRDPLERMDVSRQNPRETRRMLAALQDWRAGLAVAEARHVGAGDPEAGTSLEELAYSGSSGPGDPPCPPWPASRWQP